MVKFYTSHCPKCKVLSQMMDNKGIAYEVIDDENVYLPIADSNRVMSMPFAEVDGEIIGTKDFEKYIFAYKEG